MTKRYLTAIAKLCRAAAAVATLNATWRNDLRSSKPHGLPGRLAVTLTSYPPRYPTLALTLKSLLAQSLRPDAIYLWIAERDLAALPKDVLALAPAGIRIRTCEDVRSYKKIVPALRSDDDRFFLIADDDVYYPRRWLEDFVRAYRPGAREVLCGRAHQIVFDAAGMPLPYMSWHHRVDPGDASPSLFPTGIGGVLYERDIFDADVTRQDLFTSLCPTADDVWLFWMASRGGATFRKVGPNEELLTWPRSQRVALFVNNATANDDQIARMIERYGLPPMNLAVT